MTVAEDLVAWAHGLRLSEVPSAVQAAAARHLLDGVGLSIAARRSGAAAPSLAVAEGLGGFAEAAPLGARERIGAPAAAMADGALVHALDFDDTHAGGLVHATAVVLPAAFAVAQSAGASGEDVLRAAIVGYETVCRVASASPHGFHARGLHATQVAGVFSSAIVASLLMGLDQATTVNALGIAGSSAGGLLEFLTTGASTKQLHPGAASLNGIIAARLAAAGATGPATVFEGPHGVFAALSARDGDFDEITAGLGDRWETTRITIKPYPSCQLMHVTLDATRTVLDQIASPGEVESLVAWVHPDSAPTVCEPDDVKARPRSVYDAKFSLPWSVAALIFDRDVTVSTYDLDSIARPEVAELAARVKSRVEALADVVAADAPGRVEVRLRDGRVLVGEVATSAGGPANPLSDELLDAKFLGNCGGDTGIAQALADIVRDLGDQKDLTALHDTAAAVIDQSVEARA